MKKSHMRPIYYAIRFCVVYRQLSFEHIGTRLDIGTQLKLYFSSLILSLEFYSNVLISSGPIWVRCRDLTGFQTHVTFY